MPAARPTRAAAQERRVYAVWPHSDYKPWQADVYARDPDFVLRELDWMRAVGINTYLPLALASGRVNWPSERFPDTRALFGARSPLDTAVRGGDERGIATQLYVLAGFVGFLEDPWAAPDLRANPEWDVVGANGKGTLSGEAGTATMWGTFLWWDLGHPAVQERLLGMLAEALDRYPTAEGVHLDYIRDPGLGGCFSDACLARFQAATGIALPEALAGRRRPGRPHPAAPPGRLHRLAGGRDHGPGAPHPRAGGSAAARHDAGGRRLPGGRVGVPRRVPGLAALGLGGPGGRGLPDVLRRGARPVERGRLPAGHPRRPRPPGGRRRAPARRGGARAGDGVVRPAVAGPRRRTSSRGPWPTAPTASPSRACRTGGTRSTGSSAGTTCRGRRAGRRSGTTTRRSRACSAPPEAAPSVGAHRPSPGTGEAPAPPPPARPYRGIDRRAAGRYATD